MDGYQDQAKIKALLGAFKAELKEGSRVTLQYDPEKKSTTALVGGGSATVAGADFMRAVWSIWLGKIDPPTLGDQRIGRLKQRGERRAPRRSRAPRRDGSPAGAASTGSPRRRERSCHAAREATRCASPPGRAPRGAAVRGRRS
ncbi:chalcone isomerase family protein [Sorangium sp. So ce134]